MPDLRRFLACCLAAGVLVISNRVRHKWLFAPFAPQGIMIIATVVLIFLLLEGAATYVYLKRRKPPRGSRSTRSCATSS